jgi:hypothetical protein
MVLVPNDLHNNGADAGNNHRSVSVLADASVVIMVPPLMPVSLSDIIMMDIAVLVYNYLVSQHKPVSYWLDSEKS